MLLSVSAQTSKLVSNFIREPGSPRVELNRDSALSVINLFAFLKLGKVFENVNLGSGDGLWCMIIISEPFGFKAGHLLDIKAREVIFIMLF